MRCGVKGGGAEDSASTCLAATWPSPSSGVSFREKPTTQASAALCLAYRPCPPCVVSTGDHGMSPTRGPGDRDRPLLSE